MVKQQTLQLVDHLSFNDSMTNMAIKPLLNS